MDREKFIITCLNCEEQFVSDWITKVFCDWCEDRKNGIGGQCLTNDLNYREVHVCECGNIYYLIIGKNPCLKCGKQNERKINENG